eukprot:745820-Hanusia_phi.AAC.2
MGRNVRTAESKQGATNGKHRRCQHAWRSILKMQDRGLRVDFGIEAMKANSQTSSDCTFEIQEHSADLDALVTSFSVPTCPSVPGTSRVVATSRLNLLSSTWFLARTSSKLPQHRGNELIQPIPPLPPAVSPPSRTVRFTETVSPASAGFGVRRARAAAPGGVAPESDQ